MRSAFALRIFSGRIILNFAFVALCGALQTHFHGRGYFSLYTVKRGCCAKCCATAPVVLCYIFSGTLILNMVSTLKMAFFTPMHRARRACCTAGSAP